MVIVRLLPQDGMPEATRKATTAVGAALLAAAAALVLGWLGPVWLIGVAIAGVVALSVLAIVERRGQQRLVREQAKAAHEAHLAELGRRVEMHAALERSIEVAQLSVIEDFKRQRRHL